MDMKYFTIFCLIGLSLALPRPADPDLKEISYEIPKYEAEVNVIFGFEIQLKNSFCSFQKQDFKNSF